MTCLSQFCPCYGSSPSVGCPLMVCPSWVCPSWTSWWASPVVLSMLGRVFPTSHRTLHFGTCFIGSCGWLLSDGMCTVVGTHHRTSGRQHLGGLLMGLHLLFLFFRLVPASASHHITGRACCIVPNLPGAHRLLFQSLTMFEVRGHLLPQHGHFVQTLPAAIHHIIVATDYVIHMGLVITTHVQAEGAVGQVLTTCPTLTFKREVMEAVFVVQIRQQGHHSNRVGCMHDYEMGSPLSSGLVEEV